MAQRPAGHGHRLSAVIVNQLPMNVAYLSATFGLSRPTPVYSLPRCSPAPPAVSRISTSTTPSGAVSLLIGVYSATPADTVGRLRGRRSAACWCKLESPRGSGGLHRGHRETRRIALPRLARALPWRGDGGRRLLRRVRRKRMVIEQRLASTWRRAMPVSP